MFIEQFQLSSKIIYLYYLNSNACIVYYKVDIVCNNIWSNLKNSKTY